MRNAPPAKQASGRAPHLAPTPDIRHSGAIELSADEERTFDDDRNWFIAHPHRQYRVRAATFGDDLAGPAVLRRDDKIIVRCIWRHPTDKTAQAHLRMGFVAQPGDDYNTDVSCGHIWRELASIAGFTEDFVREAAREIARRADEHVKKDARR